MKRLDLLAIASLLGSVAVTLAVWTRLPDPFPIHFDAHGVANGWASRAWGAFTVPAIGFATYLLVRVVTPRTGSARASVRPLALVAVSLAAFMSLLQLAIVAAALDVVSVARTLPFLIGGVWLALGLLFPKIRRNAFVGVRTAWSMASDENWARTHRAASPFMVVGGIAAILAALAGTNAALPLALAAMVVSAVASTIASYVVAKRSG